MLQILRVIYNSFSWLLHCRNESFRLLRLQLLLALATHEASVLDFLVLKDVGENNCRHVSIVCCLVVM